MSDRGKALALAAVLWGLVVAGAKRPFESGFFAPDGLESLAVGGLLLAFASSQRVRSLLAAIGAPRAVFVIALVCGVLWGQLARDARVSFPFLPWSMYTQRNPPSTYLDFEVRHRDGAFGPFPFGELASFSGSKFLPRRGRMLENRIVQWLDPARGALDPDAARAQLGKLVAAYNARNRANPVVSLTVVRRSVPIGDFAGRESVGREPLFEMSFE